MHIRDVALAVLFVVVLGGYLIVFVTTNPGPAGPPTTPRPSPLTTITTDPDGDRP
jgi:hypothetical protein